MKSRFANIISLTEHTGSLNRDADQNQKTIWIGNKRYPYASEHCEAYRAIRRGTALCPTRDSEADLESIIDPRTGKAIRDDVMIQSREALTDLSRLWPNPEQGNEHLKALQAFYTTQGKAKGNTDWAESQKKYEELTEIRERVINGEQVKMEEAKGKGKDKEKFWTVKDLDGKIEKLEEKLGSTQTAQILEIYPSQLKYLEGVVSKFLKLKDGTDFATFLQKHRDELTRLPLSGHAILRGQFTTGPVGKFFRALSFARPIGILEHNPTSDLLTATDSRSVELGKMGAGTMQDTDISYNIYLRYAYFDADTATSSYTHGGKRLDDFDKLDESGSAFLAEIVQRAIIGQHYLVGNSRKFSTSAVLAVELARSGLHAPSVEAFQGVGTVEAGIERLAALLKDRIERHFHPMHHPLSYVVCAPSKYKALFDHPNILLVPNVYDAAEAAAARFLGHQPKTKKQAA